MKYAYYPGCSLTESACEYGQSSREIMNDFEAPLEEIPGWNCCGASAAAPVSQLLSYVLPARNLALAEKECPDKDVVAPCSACYLNLLRAREECLHDRKLMAKVNEALSVDGLSFSGKSRVRHLLDVLINDVGPETIKSRVTHALKGLVVAPYYGCQALRPYRVFDDPEHPSSMEPIIQALGAEVLDWTMGARCCGASLMATKKEVALPSVALILEAAKEADVIVTICPMCQMNLDAYQSEAFKLSGQDAPVAIIYLPQLMGLAFGHSEKEMCLNRNLCLTPGFIAKARRQVSAEEPAENVLKP